MKFRFDFGKWGTPLAVALATALVVSVSGAIGGTGAPQFTGCLASGGNLLNVHIGTSPLHPCVNSQKQITWSQTGPQGQAGAPGTPGKPGTPGTPGIPGTPGTSVTSATEPAGTNCPTGGSSFTSVSGTTYACNGAKGDKGDTGATGPDSLAALAGSPCTIEGRPSTLIISETPSGVVTMSCPPVFEASVTMTGLADPSIDLLDDTHNSLSNHCNGLSCAIFVPHDEQVRIDFSSGDPNTGGGTPFTYTCPGEDTQTAEGISGFYTGKCPVASQDATIATDYAVTASATG